MLQLFLSLFTVPVKLNEGSQALRGDMKIEVNDNLESGTGVFIVLLRTCCKWKVSLTMAPLPFCRLIYVQIMVLRSLLMFVYLSKTHFVGVPGRWN